MEYEKKSTIPTSKNIRHHQYLYDNSNLANNWDFLDQLDLLSIKTRNNTKLLKSLSTKIIKSTELPYDNPNRLQKLFLLSKYILESSKMVNNKGISQIHKNKTEIEKLKKELQEIKNKKPEIKCPICLIPFESIDFLDIHMNSKHLNFMDFWKVLRLPQTQLDIFQSNINNVQPQSPVEDLTSVLNGFKMELQKTQEFNENKMMDLFSQKMSNFEKNINEKMDSLRADNLAQTMPNPSNQYSAPPNKKQNSYIPLHINKPAEIPRISKQPFISSQKDKKLNQSSDPSFFEFSPNPSEKEKSSKLNDYYSNASEINSNHLDIPYINSSSQKSNIKDDQNHSKTKNQNQQKKKFELVFQQSTEIYNHNDEILKINNNEDKGVEININPDQSDSVRESEKKKPLTISSNISINKKQSENTKNKKDETKDEKPKIDKQSLQVSNNLVVLDIPFESQNEPEKPKQKPNLPSNDEEIFQSPKINSNPNPEQVKERNLNISDINSHEKTNDLVKNARIKVSNLLNMNLSTESEQSESLPQTNKRPNSKPNDQQNHKSKPKQKTIDESSENNKNNNKRHNTASKSKKPNKDDIYSSLSSTESSYFSYHSSHGRRSKSLKRHRRNVSDYSDYSDDYNEYDYDDDYSDYRRRNWRKSHKPKRSSSIKNSRRSQNHSDHKHSESQSHHSRHSSNEENRNHQQKSRKEYKNKLAITMNEPTNSISYSKNSSQILNLQISEDLSKLDQVKEKFKPKLKIGNLIIPADQPFLLSESSDSEKEVEIKKPQSPISTPKANRQAKSNILTPTSSKGIQERQPLKQHRSSSSSNKVKPNPINYANATTQFNTALVERSPKINSISTDDLTYSYEQQTSEKSDNIKNDNKNNNKTQNESYYSNLYTNSYYYDSSSSSDIDKLIYSSDTYRKKRSESPRRNRNLKPKNSISPASYISPVRKPSNSLIQRNNNKLNSTVQLNQMPAVNKKGSAWKDGINADFFDISSSEESSKKRRINNANKDANKNAENKKKYQENKFDNDGDSERLPHSPERNTIQSRAIRPNKKTPTKNKDVNKSSELFEKENQDLFSPIEKNDSAEVSSPMIFDPLPNETPVDKKQSLSTSDNYSNENIGLGSNKYNQIQAKNSKQKEVLSPTNRHVKKQAKPQTDNLKQNQQQAENLRQNQNQNQKENLRQKQNQQTDLKKSSKPEKQPEKANQNQELSGYSSELSYEQNEIPSYMAKSPPHKLHLNASPRAKKKKININLDSISNSSDNEDISSSEKNRNISPTEQRKSKNSSNSKQKEPIQTKNETEVNKSPVIKETHKEPINTIPEISSSKKEVQKEKLSSNSVEQLINEEEEPNENIAEQQNFEEEELSYNVDDQLNNEEEEPLNINLVEHPVLQLDDVNDSSSSLIYSDGMFIEDTIEKPQTIVKKKDSSSSNLLTNSGPKQKLNAIMSNQHNENENQNPTLVTNPIWVITSDEILQNESNEQPNPFEVTNQVPAGISEEEEIDQEQDSIPFEIENDEKKDQDESSNDKEINNLLKESSSDKISPSKESLPPVDINQIDQEENEVEPRISSNPIGSEMNNSENPFQLYSDSYAESEQEQKQDDMPVLLELAEKDEIEEEEEEASENLESIQNNQAEEDLSDSSALFAASETINNEANEPPIEENNTKKNEITSINKDIEIEEEELDDNQGKEVEEKKEEENTKIQSPINSPKMVLSSEPEDILPQNSSSNEQIQVNQSIQDEDSYEYEEEEEQGQNMTHFENFEEETEIEYENEYENTSPGKEKSAEIIIEVFNESPSYRDESYEQSAELLEKQTKEEEEEKQEEPINQVQKSNEEPNQLNTPKPSILLTNEEEDIQSAKQEETQQTDEKQEPENNLSNEEKQLNKNGEINSNPPELSQNIEETNTANKEAVNHPEGNLGSDEYNTSNSDGFQFESKEAVQKPYQPTQNIQDLQQSQMNAKEGNTEEEEYSEGISLERSHSMFVQHDEVNGPFIHITSSFINLPEQYFYSSPDKIDKNQNNTLRRTAEEAPTTLNQVKPLPKPNAQQELPQRPKVENLPFPNKKKQKENANKGSIKLTQSLQSLGKSNLTLDIDRESMESAPSFGSSKIQPLPKPQKQNSILNQSNRNNEELNTSQLTNNNSDSSSSTSIESASEEDENENGQISLSSLKSSNLSQSFKNSWLINSGEKIQLHENEPVQLNRGIVSVNNLDLASNQINIQNPQLQLLQNQNNQFQGIHGEVIEEYEYEEDTNQDDQQQLMGVPPSQIVNQQNKRFGSQLAPIEEDDDDYNEQMPSLQQQSNLGRPGGFGLPYQQQQQHNDFSQNLQQKISPGLGNRSILAPMDEEGNDAGQMNNKSRFGNHSILAPMDEEDQVQKYQQQNINNAQSAHQKLPPGFGNQSILAPMDEEDDNQQYQNIPINQTPLFQSNLQPGFGNPSILASMDDENQQFQQPEQLHKLNQTPSFQKKVQTGLGQQSILAPMEEENDAQPSPLQQNLSPGFGNQSILAPMNEEDEIQPSPLQQKLPPGFGNQSILAPMDDDSQLQQQQQQIPVTLGGRFGGAAKKTVPGLGPSLAPMEEEKPMQSQRVSGLGSTLSPMSNNNRNGFGSNNMNQFGNSNMNQINNMNQVDNSQRNQSKGGFTISNGIGKSNFKNSQNSPLAPMNQAELQQNIPLDSNYFGRISEETFEEQEPKINYGITNANSINQFSQQGDVPHNQFSAPKKSGGKIPRVQSINKETLAQIMNSQSSEEEPSPLNGNSLQPNKIPPAQPIRLQDAQFSSNNNSNQFMNEKQSGFSISNGIGKKAGIPSSNLSLDESAAFKQDEQQQSPSPSKKLTRSKPLGSVQMELPLQLMEDEELMNEIKLINSMSEQNNEEEVTPINCIPFQEPFFQQQNSFFTQSGSSNDFNKPSNGGGFSVVHANGAKQNQQQNLPNNMTGQTANKSGFTVSYGIQKTRK